MRFFKLMINAGHPTTGKLVDTQQSHPYHLPGIICGACHKTWGQGHVPYICPKPLRSKLISRSGPLPGVEHRRLQAECRRMFSESGQELSTFFPGMYFLPSIVGVWNYGPLDMLTTDVGSIVVSERTVNLMRELGLSGDFFPTTVVSLPRSTKLRRFQDATRTTADESVADLLEGKVIAEPYFEFVVTEKSQLIWPITDECVVCGLQDFVPGAFALKQEQWTGHHFFQLAPTRSIVVTEEVRTAVESRGLTGMYFKELTGQLPPKFR